MAPIEAVVLVVPLLRTIKEKKKKPRSSSMFMEIIGGVFALVFVVLVGLSIANSGP